MRVIGLTGGVGAGKSRILEILEKDYHAQVIQADALAKELEEPGKAGYEAIVRELGDGFLREDGTIDNALFAERIFGDSRALETVNSIIHPLVWQEICGRIRRSGASLAVVEAALFTKNEDDIFDEIWYVYTSKEERVRRLMQNRGYSREKCLRIIGNQPDEQAFFQAADRVIDNNGTPEEAKEQIRRIFGSQ